MTPDIQSAARRLFGVIYAPSGSIGVLAWPNSSCPKIRVFVDQHHRHEVSDVPLEFEGFVVEIEIQGEIIPFNGRSHCNDVSRIL